MKKFFLIPVFLFFYHGFAQTYTQGVDEKLQLLDKSGITSHILYDRVYPGANLTAFNQIVADTSRAAHFFLAYAELQTADDLARWPPVSVLKEAVAVQTAQNKLPLGIIHADFHHLDELAFQDNLVALQGADSLLTDVPGRPRSPWLAKTALVVSPLAEYTGSTSVTLITGPDFTLQAAADPITSLSVDIGDGQGWQAVPLSGELMLNFPGPGEYYLHFKVTLGSGEIRYTYAALKVYEAPPVAAKAAMVQKAGQSDCLSGTIFASRPFQGYDEAQPYSGVGNYQVFLGGADLDNPVIVLEGFDPLEGEDEGNNINDIYFSFLRYNDNSNLGNDLRFGPGYDIIPLNFANYTVNTKTIHGGTDFIERNAMVLIDLIEQVNSCKTGNTPLKIIGFSMGGLVARYALRYMELNGIAHDTDLFVSVDTPHKGAVVPMGVQEMAHLADDLAPYGPVAQADDMLHSPAARQMLIHHFLANSLSPQGHAWHNQFYTELEAMGFPQQTRNIAVVNGSAQGTPINTPGQQYVEAQGQAGGLLVLSARAHARLHYAPGSGLTKNVMKFKLYLRLLLVDLLVYSRTRQVATPQGGSSYENTPGGYFDVAGLTQDLLGDNGVFHYNKGTLSTYYLNAHLILGTPNFSFIPVKSALAYSGAEEDLYEDFSARDLVCTGETPLDSYYIPPQNQRHTALTGESANFILQEILGNPQAPNLNVAGDNIIEGPSTVCNADTVFSLRDCTITSADWSVSSNLQIVAAGPQSLTVRAIDNAVKGAGSITASFNGQVAMEKTVWVGKPQIPQGSLSGPTSVSAGMIVNYFGASAPGATSYQWKVPYPYIEGQLDISDPDWRILSTAGYSSVSAFTGTEAHTGYVQLMGENGCGCGGALTLQVNAPGSGGGSGGLPDKQQGGIPKAAPAGDSPEADTAQGIRLYPNPAREKVTLEIITTMQAAPTGPREMHSVTVFDTEAKRMEAAITPVVQGKQVEITVSHLAPGSYTVRIETDTGAVTKKLLVQ